MAMQRGIDLEPLARTAYEFQSGNDVEKVGFMEHPSIPMSGASPDGLIGEEGLLEIKCPNTANHIDYLLAGKPPAEYQNQMLWQMECTGRQWCDFVSYDDRMPIELQLFVVRFERDEDRISAMKEAVIKFQAEVEELMNRLMERMAND
jgi:predicted phage-related endonuclease